MRICVLLGVGLVSLTLLAHAESAQQVNREQAEKILMPFKQDLQQALREGLSKSLADGRVGHVEAIFMQSLCLTCHGESLAMDVADEIKRRYPQDEAIGFKPGELRGIFWLEFPATEEIPPGEA
jgi:hypothetical protein